jgi:hypothetical protein
MAEQLGAEYDTPTDTAGNSRAGWARSGRGDEAQSAFGMRRGARARGRGCAPRSLRSRPQGPASWAALLRRALLQARYAG